MDAALAQFGSMLGDAEPSRPRGAVLSALNGVVGDHFVETGNPLAIPMRLRANGMPLQLKRRTIAAEISQPSGRLAILVHGLCLNERHWNRKGHDHGTALARDLDYTPLYLHYNTGLHISTNGRSFAEMLDVLVKQWPVPIVFLGTPHHGVPLERVGQWADFLIGKSRYTAPFARLGRIRSAGITDLRYGNIVDEDWEGHDRFKHAGDMRQVVPLPPDVRCHAIAGIAGPQVGGSIIGDGLVPVGSALGQHEEPNRDLALPKPRQRIVRSINHMELLNRPEVYKQIRKWLRPLESASLSK